MTRHLKNRLKEPPVPAERAGTVRREIMGILEDQLLSAKEISGTVGISVKEVYEHLVHIQKSASQEEKHLRISPAKCKKCGFVFKKRDRLKKPGKCPVCRGESIEDPLFSIQKTGRMPY